MLARQFNKQKLLLYKTFLLMLFLFSIHNKLSLGQNPTKKKETASKQLNYAVDLYFNAGEEEIRSGYKNVIHAYIAVEEFFPNSKDNILVAKGNLAGLYKKLGQFDRAIKLYEEVLKVLPNGSPKRYQNYKGLIRCLEEYAGSKDNYNQYVDFKKKYKEAAGIFTIEYSILCLSASLKKASLGKGRELRKLTENILKEIVLSETELTTGELIIIRHILGQIQLYDIWHSIRIMKENKKIIDDSVENKIKLLVLNSSVSLTSDFKSITGEIDHQKMLTLGDKEYITYMTFQRKMLAFSIISVLRKDIGEKQLSLSGQKCLKLIREYHFIELTSLLKKILKSLDKSGDIDQVKSILKLFNKNS